MTTIRILVCFTLGIVSGLVRINAFFQHPEKYHHPCELAVVPSFRGFMHELNGLNRRDSANCL
jgi:hypothetical protein